MGDIWVSDGLMWRKGGVPHVRATAGWNAGRFVWRHNGTSWVQVWSRDTTPPAAPIVTLSLWNGTKNVINVQVKTPNERVVRTVVKVGVNTWSTGPLTNDGTYYAQGANYGINGIFEEWSEFWKNQSFADGRTGAKQIPATYQTFTFPLDTPINVSAYVQDDFFNWSAAGTASIRTAKADPPAPVLRTLSAYLNPGDSHTWNHVGGNWSSQAGSNGYLYQGGGYNQQGMWFHGDGIRANLAPAAGINAINILIQRVNDGHGVSGGAIARVGVHGHTSRPGGNPGGLAGTMDALSLSRGQAAWWATNSGWWAGFQNGANRGFGLAYQTSSYTSPGYIVCYGRGTTSGQVYLEWRQY